MNERIYKPAKSNPKYDFGDAIITVLIITSLMGAFFTVVFLTSGRILPWYNINLINARALIVLSWPVISILGIIVGFISLLIRHNKKVVTGIILEIVQLFLFGFFWMVTFYMV